MKRTFILGSSAAALMFAAAVALTQGTSPASGSGMSDPATSATKSTPSSQTSSETKSMPASQTSATSTHPMKHMSKARHKVVDLNSASKEQLMKLPGIGEMTADKIIAARPFKSRAQLVSKNLVSKTEYHKIRTWVTAKQTS
jgi:competence protein ComEA